MKVRVSMVVDLEIDTQDEEEALAKVRALSPQETLEQGEVQDDLFDEEVLR